MLQTIKTNAQDNVSWQTAVGDFSILIPGIGNGTAMPVFDLVRDSYELIITGLPGETHLGFVSFDSFGPEPSVSKIDIPGIGTGTAILEQNLAN